NQISDEYGRDAALGTATAETAALWQSRCREREWEAAAKCLRPADKFPILRQFAGSFSLVFTSFQGVSENKEMDGFSTSNRQIQGKKRRNPLWIPSIFNAVAGVDCRL